MKLIAYRMPMMNIAVVFLWICSHIDKTHRESFTIPIEYCHLNTLLLPILSFFFALPIHLPFSLVCKQTIQIDLLASSSVVSSAPFTLPEIEAKTRLYIFG